ncbi:uncharacterized protein TRUGW13939_01378 [Talaromyces rugulosus]|uniref:Thioester reductase (TE) domain-containing protein n=1 Tax=Talaromyces rugulosus TaxID=121627 RepID=A0A7H8QM89_TALRU|nr:uncharacterized protein TRUGW13939_01378 [Talaromyces rugulosus]QKX54293.1 hypothetical protein TRUGW13939_01378 [Talaromyces rugulosus]
MRIVNDRTVSSEPRLGLPMTKYEDLVGSVTHFIHNAWHMSVKRPLAGFESQFQVVRNLIDFASDAVSYRPGTLQLTFQVISSIGVVGNYGVESGQMKKKIVPEDKVDIDSVLPIGYGEAKWGCERMLDETLHRYPDQLRTMAVRLG